MANPKYPFGPADVRSVAPGATVNLSVSNSKTIVNLGELSAAMTLNAVIDEDLEAGAELHITAKSDGTARNITFGTGFTSPALSGTISKTKVASFVYNGATFLPQGTPLQID